MDSLATKLSRTQFPGISAFTAAPIGFVMDESFTNLQIAEIIAREALDAMEAMQMEIAPPGLPGLRVSLAGGSR